MDVDAGRIEARAPLEPAARPRRGRPARDLWRAGTPSRWTAGRLERTAESPRALESVRARSALPGLRIVPFPESRGRQRPRTDASPGLRQRSRKPGLFERRRLPGPSRPVRSRSLESFGSPDRARLGRRRGTRSRRSAAGRRLLPGSRRSRGTLLVRPGRQPRSQQPGRQEWRPRRRGRRPVGRQWRSLRRRRGPQLRGQSLRAGPIGTLLADRLHGRREQGRPTSSPSVPRTARPANGPRRFLLFPGRPDPACRRRLDPAPLDRSPHRR
jgi:hypothetical protein